MKKTLIALAALAATGASFAQVTLYGAVDASYYRTDSEGVSASGISNSQLGSSKLGFMGTEDLGGGLNAVFKLEGGLANDVGVGKGSNGNNQSGGIAATNTGGQGLVFQRYSYVGLQGGFGEVHIGREYTGTFLNVVGSVDPFSTNGTGDSTQMTLALGATAKQATLTSASNMVTYMTPAMSGFSAKVQAFWGENASGAENSADGSGYSVSGGYANGPISVSLGQQVTRATAGATTVVVPLAVNNGANGVVASGAVAVTGATGDYTQRALAASYNFDSFKLVYTYVSENLITVHETATADAIAATNRSNLLGVVVPMGQTNFKASYIKSVANSGVTNAIDDNGTMWAVGADYALSKRTKVYATYGRASNDTGSLYGISQNRTQKDPASTGYSFGVYHSF